MSNFLLGGRLGDLIHALYVAKNTPGRHDLLITDRRDLHSDGFLFDLQTTYDELYPIITVQEYCNSFLIYSYEEVINLSMWRRYAYSASWTQLLSNTFGVPVNGEPWIKWAKDDKWKDTIVVHASVQEARKGHHWEIPLSMYEGRCLFVGNKEEYKAFGRDIPFYQPLNLSEHFTIINSCKFFIGNQSAPLAIAHSLGVPRLAMLNEIDKLHYTGEERWHQNYFWIAKDTAFFPAMSLENA